MSKRHKAVGGAMNGHVWSKGDLAGLRKLRRKQAKVAKAGREKQRQAETKRIEAQRAHQAKMQAEFDIEFPRIQLSSMSQ